MLRLLVTSVGIFLTVSAAAQEASQSAPEPKTKLEAFQGQTGSVVIKGYSEVGTVKALGSVEIDAMEFTDAGTGRKQSGVVVEIVEVGRLENTNRAFIDFDEVESLLKGIDYISRATPDVSKLGQFEATYKTRGYFSVTTYSSARSGKIEAALKAGYIRPATVYLSLAQLGEVRALIEQARQRVDAAR